MCEGIVSMWPIFILIHSLNLNEGEQLKFSLPQEAHTSVQAYVVRTLI